MNKHWEDKARHELERYKKQLKQLYGFLADPSKMLWENVQDYYNNMDPRTCFIGRPLNMACHNLFKINKAPKGIEFLLGLGDKYCVQRTKLDPELIDKMMERLTKNVRWKYIFRNEPESDETS